MNRKETTLNTIYPPCAESQARNSAVGYGAHTCSLSKQPFKSPAIYTTRVVQKVKNICPYSPRTCFVAADHWFLVFSVMLKSRTFSCGKCKGGCGCYSVQSVLASPNFFLFPKWITLLVKRFANNEDLNDAVKTWLNNKRSHGMKRVHTNWCQGTTSSDLMSKATMRKGRQRYVPKLVYSVSVLLLKNILVWKRSLFYGRP